jgi:hypothetical protein
MEELLLTSKGLGPVVLSRVPVLLGVSKAQVTGALGLCGSGGQSRSGL